ncbi:MAG: family 43 glycosylhydrolase [Bacteroidetes bacterium]|nr:family 43 glycosylhydrolase [Bacteroidota bacterium]
MVAPSNGNSAPKEPVGVVNEGPFILKQKENILYGLFANHYASQDYGIGYATSRSPHGPWTKYDKNPIMQSPDTLSGTGHCSFSGTGKEISGWYIMRITANIVYIPAGF